MFVSIRKGDLSVRWKRHEPLKLKPLKGEPILSALADDGRLFLAISDLHLGLTSRLGLRRPLPEEEASEDCNRLIQAGRATGATGVIILGDLKHGLFEPNVYEKRALRALTEELVTRFQVWVMKGNHDYGVEDVMDPRVRMIGKAGLELDGVAFIHGHSLPRLSHSIESYDTIVSGHLHPQLMLEDSWVPVWLKLENHDNGRPREVVFLPHFSRYASRAGYRSGPPTTITPFLNRLDLDDYGFEMKDLMLTRVAKGRASDLMSMMKESGAGRI